MDAAGGSVELNSDGKYTHKPDVAIVVFGEHPYAEYQGDRETLEYGSVNSPELKIMQRLQAQKIPVVAVFLSGRPLWVNRELNAADAFVAAWLPGSEGEGIADVLFRKKDGSINDAFTGKLSFSWPETVMPVIFKNGDEPVGALFPRGYGMNYASTATLAHLSEDTKAAPDRHDASVLYADKHVVAPWTINIQDDVAGVRFTTMTQTSASKAFMVTRNNTGVLIDWNGSGRGAFLISGSGNDLQSECKGKALQVHLMVNEKPTAQVFLGMRCGLTYAQTQAIKNGALLKPADEGLYCQSAKPAFYDVTKQLNDAKNAVTITLPLSCFAKQGASLNNVMAPLALVTKGEFKATLTDARFVKTTSTACPTGFADSPVTRIP